MITDKDIQIHKEKLEGFYRGVVEDNDDPLKVGRCRIRVWGVHTSEKNKGTFEGVSTDELPWAEPAFPITEGSISGFGVWSIPLPGSHVFVFFENGDHMSPRYFASVPGIQPSIRPSTTKGFSDPSGTYPTRLGESDVHRLARGVTSETAIAYRQNSTNRDLGVQTGDDDVWNEPAPAYGAQYPHNFVIATHGGLLIELDSTSGQQRIHICHPSNSFIEIDSTGRMIIKNNRDMYSITLGKRRIDIKGGRDITVGSPGTGGGNDTVRVHGKRISKFDQGKEETVTTGDMDITLSGGNYNLAVTGNITITASGNVDINGATITLN